VLEAVPGRVYNPVVRRRGFNVAAVVSLVVFVAATWRWVRSHAGEVILVDSRAGQLLLIGVDAPRARVDAARDNHTIDAFLNQLVRPTAVRGSQPPTAPTERRALGFWYVRGDTGRITYPDPTGRYRALSCPFWMVAIPYWFVAPLAAVLPAAWLWQRRRAARRAGSNACAQCGYDLRATPGRCPECGAVPETPGKAG
jgi:hypothetical protein